MHIQKLEIIITSIFALLFCATVQAKMEEEKIACPSIEMIHQMAPLMNDISEHDGVYKVGASTDLKNGMVWGILSEDIIANSSKQAAIIAQKRCANVTHMVYPSIRTSIAEGYNNTCLYYDETLPNPIVSIVAYLKEKL